MLALPDPWVTTRAPARSLGRAGGMLVLLLLTMPYTAEGQVGLGSLTARVALLASVPARVVLLDVGSPIKQGRSGNLLETSVKVQIEANTRCRLLVRGTGEAAARISVQDTDGEFRSLGLGAAVVVAQEENPAGEWSSEIRYRIEDDNVAEHDAPLPVRYEIAVVPTL